MSSTLLSIPTACIPQFDGLYVISDLHLGGPTGFQIFNSGNELARLIDYLATINPAERIALLINGDFVDFLAERPSLHFDPAGAIEKLDRIATNDASFKQVFTALHNFAATKNRFLIINLGNHDLELALPWVAARLMEILAGNNYEARGRITFSFEGTGFLCWVGNARILCVHGNEVDTWNVADYETIRRFGREVMQGRPIDSWIPNAGSQLVIDVMNDLKSRYPFIDLLKPEVQGVLPTIAALAPDQRDKLRAIGATAARLILDKIKRATGFLGEGDEDDYLAGRSLAMPGLLPPDGNGFGQVVGRNTFEADRRQYAASLLDNAEARLGRDVDPLTLILDDQRETYLGATAAFMEWVRGSDTSEVLRKALIELREDRSFDPSVEDDTFRLLDDQIGDVADFVVAGHTHLERALPRKKRSGWYFNSGTWARLIKLEGDVLGDSAKFREVFKAFGAGTMAALDSYPGLIRRQLTVVAFSVDEVGTHGELRHVTLDPTDQDVLPENGQYRFTKG